MRQRFTVRSPNAGKQSQIYSNEATQPSLNGAALRSNDIEQLAKSCLG